MPVHRRLTWDELPSSVRDWAQGVLGAPVVRVAHATGGYSPGTADALFCADGRAVFLKAGHPSLNPHSPGMLRSEGAVLAQLPSGLPVAGLVDYLDEGPDGWVALLLEHVEGAQPLLPWTDVTIAAALDSIAELAGALTPAPVGIEATAAQALAPMFSSWRGVGGEPDLDPWLVDRLDLIQARSAAVLAHTVGDTLLHLDLRADNLLQRSDGRLIVVDWAWAVRGAAWVDPALLAIEFISSGTSVDADAWIRRIASAHGISTSLIVDLLVGVLGFFEYEGRQPDPPRLPTLRSFQRFQAAALRNWLQTSRLSADLRGHAAARGHRAARPVDQP